MGCFIEVHGGGYPIVVAHFLGPLAIKRPDRSGIPGGSLRFPQPAAGHIPNTLPGYPG